MKKINEQISKLDEQISKLYDDIYDLKEQKRKLEMKDYDYTNKYIHIKDYGYMHVDWQKYEEKSLYGDERMFFQGMSFCGEYSVYHDDSYFSYHGLNDWYIPYETFKRYVRSGEIIEITKEEFISKFKEFSSNLDENFEKFV